jgi:sugar transferase (PEP-CTERM system associated)
MIRVFSHWLPANTLLQVGIDLILACIFLALAIAWYVPGNLQGISAVLPYALLFTFGMIVLNCLFGVYRGVAKRTAPRNLAFAFVIVCFLPVVPMAYGMLSPVAHIDTWRDELGMALLLSLGLTAALRGYAMRNGVGMLRARRVMVLGTGMDAAAVEQSLTGSGQSVHFVGFYPSHSDEATEVSPDRVLSFSDSIICEALRSKVNEIIVAVREQRADAILARELLECRLAGINIFDLSSHFERAFGQVRLNSLRASWLIFGEGFRQGLVRMMVKRLFDIFAAVLLLAVLWPLMLLSAVLIVLESGFPIFYCQERVGHGGRLFRVVKFRSMRRDAEHDGKPRWASCNDARVTHVGVILRRLRIDELPQLWNVLKGEMSLCGPRPERPYFVAQLARELPFYEARHSIKPGVTGWAQVRYRYGESVEDAAQKLQYDLYYVKNHTLFLDVVILFKTVGVVLTGAGAR